MYTKKCFVLTFIAIALLTVCFSCSKEDIKDPPVDPEVDEINAWIYDIMYKHYLWYEDIPSKESLKFNAEPEDFFYSLLSKKDGTTYNGGWLVFSQIEEKQPTSKTIIENIPTYGFEFGIYRRTGDSFVTAQILYVLPGSPADEAGLKRGDWILSVGEQQAKITDYSVLETGGEVIFNMGRYNSTNTDVVSAGSVKVAAARIMDNTPLLKDTVIQAGGKNIGYLLYNHFTSGPTGVSDKVYDNQMKEIFRNFKSKQVNEFVLDLRYNSGGLVTSAILLSSLLAPTEALGNIWGYFEYNDKIATKEEKKIFESASNMANLNINLQKLYVLTGNVTASSSEAVINSLIPYMGREHIRLLGTKTIGKTVGSTTFGEKENYGYLLHPIILRVSNKDHNADYANGFSPDIEFKEHAWGQPLGELGTTNDPLFNLAINEITGPRERMSIPLQPATPHEMIYNSLDKKGVKGFIFE
jgi:C-terminal processing protease CtpA/Prc